MSAPSARRFVVAARERCERPSCVDAARKDRGREQRLHSQSRQQRMEPLWSPVVATGGNQLQIGRTRNRKSKRNPLPPAATGCLGKYMVRRGSTVRVRQRASQKRPADGFFVASTAYVHRSNASLNLSPRSVPNIAEAVQSWLKQRRLTSSSTSMNRRYPATEGRKDIDASESRRSTV